MVARKDPLCPSRTASAQLETAGDTPNDLAARIVDTALELAEESGWQAVRLHDVAARLDIPPAAVLNYYRDLNDVADAWFRRGWRAMLAPKPAGFDTQPAARRLELCLVAWFNALAPHREETVQMLQAKMHLPHPHHWVPMVFNLSRTIHWLREAAGLPAPYGSRRAQMEEIGLTWLFVATLGVWARDRSDGQQRTRRFLRRRLDEADTLMTRVWGGAAPPTTR